jgi:hypothetical protein
MLLMLSLAAGLFFMHGVQSSASPADLHGVPLVSSAAMHVSYGHGGHPAGHSRQGDDHHHPGGQMCLALLTLVSLLLFGALLVRPALGRTTAPTPVAPWHRRSGRPPPSPSIFQLSVLRL